MRRGALISLGNGAPPTPSVIWDLSQGGCRLAAPHAVRLPAVFVLILGPNDSERRHCRVVWQRGAYVGVQFIEAAEAERIADSLPEVRPGLYRNNDRGAFASKPRKTAAAAAAPAKSPRKPPRWTLDLY